MRERERERERESAQAPDGFLQGGMYANSFQLPWSLKLGSGTVNRAGGCGHKARKIEELEPKTLSGSSHA